MQDMLTLKNVILIARPPRTGNDPVDDVQKSHSQSRELCCPYSQCRIRRRIQGLQ